MFRRSPGHPTDVRASASRTVPSYLLVEVSDTGCGIMPKTWRPGRVVRHGQRSRWDLTAFFLYPACFRWAEIGRGRSELGRADIGLPQ
jgi:hypothetical protein